MGRIMAIGGKDNAALYEYLIKLAEARKAGKRKTHFLFVATASGDRAGYFKKTAGIARPLGCSVKPLYLIRRSYTQEALDRLLAWADVVYVCGGDTLNMIRVWKETGFDLRLREIFDTDSALLAGTSAGGICWFGRGFSDSSPTPEYGPHGWVAGLDFLPGRDFCPHFGSRGKAFKQALKDSHTDGIALSDSTAYLYDNGKESFIKADPLGDIRLFSYKGSRLYGKTPDHIIL